MRKSSILAASTVLAAPAILSGAYANTLTNLIPDLYAGLDVVSRELVGFIPSVARNSNAERAAEGQDVVYHIAPEAQLFDVTPAMATPEPADRAIGNGTMKITKSKGVEFGWTGEEQRGLNTGAGYLSVQADNFAQGIRALTNAIERDLAVEAAINASRAWGTAGQVPFATNLGEVAQMRKILDDNGAPPSDRSLVMNTSAGASLRTLGNLSKVNEAGTSMTLRDGQLLDVHGFSMKESGQAVNHIAGTGAAVVTNATGYAVGATSIVLKAAGTGTLKAGDVVSFAGDTNLYVVAAPVAAVSGATLQIAKPGLRVAIPAVETAVTVAASHGSNIAFSRNAIHLVTRAPALPQEGDAAIDRISITDPRSGMVFEVSLYAGFRKIRADVTAAWGVKAVKSEHIGLLLG